MNISQCNWFKLLVLLAALYLLGQVTPVYLPVIISMVLAFILKPLVDRLCRSRLWPGGYMPRSAATLFSMALFAALASVLLGIVILPLINEFDKFVIDMPSLMGKIQRLTTIIGERTQPEALPEALKGLLDQGLSSAASFFLDVVRRVLNSLLGFATQVVELVVVPVLTYYFLKDGYSIKRALVNVFPPSRRSAAGQIIGEMGEVLSAYIRGQALVSVVIGALVFSGIYFLGIDYPLVMGLLATITETIPIIGPIIGAIPAIVLAYLISPTLALKVVGFYLLIHQLENHIVVPNIMGHTIHLHPVVVIISLLVGGQLYGVAGMILAVPVTALLKVLLKHLWYYEES